MLIYYFGIFWASMVYGRYYELVPGGYFMVYRPTNITGGVHPVWWSIYCGDENSVHILHFLWKIPPLLPRLLPSMSKPRPINCLWNYGGNGQNWSPRPQNILNGLVLLGKFSPETIDFPMKIMGLSGVNFPLTKPIPLIFTIKKIMGVTLKIETYLRKCQTAHLRRV